MRYTLIFIVGLVACGRDGAFGPVHDELVDCWPNCPSNGDDDGDGGDPAAASALAFPTSFDDQNYFAAAVTTAPFSLECGDTPGDLRVTDANGGAAVIYNDCSSGVVTLSNASVVGDGVNGNVDEGYRCDGSGVMNITGSWLEAGGGGHPFQCYDPGNATTATINVESTTFRGHTGAAAALFIADSFAAELHVKSVMFWGGTYGLRFHTDGRPGSLYVNDVCFYGVDESNHSFDADAFLFDPDPPTIAQWNNVNWCTIENGVVVVQGPIASP